ncbi:disease resistance protein Roq1-like isoform X2 [Quercus robur]|uniref:disease resistance protein Roq1-like isoform X2 n=1 Tax=Quercus robur TaxID=38942 RepID=UPI002161F963|nr:disease resistance protein Roq1-like isoform X2 [Quercus robur]XP_050279022.1 disease resistance protein Roq1-like isoform X2 [Quercus robur]XP_050279029.1 disease resistance protein Roq1-like isoform X2 [Quercus robur]XP_050279038.1 disease resistance protein Roq1-like isoform X2 [Quercus robur]XP_050279047.1 disease resistance protein Roq1-like isoform X2 [Quercus robur]XP_050279058.1 disease resistance protein Roq1-like isoform X2 [Quercus robur]XP_050279069.1 disease resistance protein
MGTQNASSSSSSSCFPSSSSIVPGWRYEYHVFLSFRGSDTRKKFTSHLYEALKRNGITTFRDDESLERGEFISPELMRAIEESRFAVVIFSKNYASSSWCLTELAKIVECMDKKKLTVLPVFYDVDPSDVRKLRGTFAEAFAKHLNDNNENVQNWKDVVTKVSGISGWDLRDESEATVIQKIIQRISLELNHKFSIVFEHLVGMDSRVKEMLDLCMREGLDCVHFVGICGMGGIGKTTLAREIYGKIYSDFEACSFLENVREDTKSKGLVSLQKILLSKILIGIEINLHDLYEGINVIGTRLCNKKVLIVLDDVNEEKQLKALAGNGGWFGPGSIIIVTSRDRHLLRRHGVKHIYEAKELNEDEALELFSWKAFKKPYPEENYEDLSMDFVRYANGLPLALEVLGSSLFGRKLDAWRSAQDKLEAKSNRDIMEILQISLFGLEDTQRELFLDIACFFKGEQVYCVRDTLESLGHYPDCDIYVLMDKSLITIASDGTLSMHDLLQEMGQDIVCCESPKEPGKRSRLWCYKDVLHVLKNNTGTEFVEGIVLKMPVDKNERLSAEAFSKMKILRFLKIGYVEPQRGHNRGHVQLPQGLIYLSNELRIIDWHGYPLKSMPTNFQPIKLVELRMHYSGIEKLWKGIMILNELKLIDLSHSQKLIEIPNLSGALNLEKLILQCCTRLCKIHASVGELKKLIQLDMNGCKNLSSLPNAICSLMSLKTLNLSFCSRLVKLPEDLGNLEGLEELDVSGTAIRGLFSSSVPLKNLKKLSIGGCAFLLSKKILNFPLFQRSPDPMGMLTRALSSLSSLTELNLSYCNLQTVPDAIGCCLSSLNHLNLRGNKFDCLPKNIIRLSNLETLFLSDCKDLRLLSELPSNIKYFEAEGCTSLETLPFRPEDVFSPHLYLINCVKLIENQSFGDMFSTMLARYIQSPFDLSYQNFIIPGSEIPKWFSHQSEGTSLNLQGPSDYTGIAVCVVFEIRPHLSLHQPPSEFYKATHWIHLICSVDGSQSIQSVGLSEQFGKIDSCHLWIRYAPFKRKRDKELSQIDANRLSQIKLGISTVGPGLVVTKWGARLVYEQDIEDLKKNMAGSSSCSITPYEDNLDDSAKDTKIKRNHDDFEGDGAGPSGEGTSNEVDEPQPKRIHTTP